MGLRPVLKAVNGPVDRLQAETGIRLRMPRAEGKAERPQCGEKRGESPVRKGAEGTRSRGECRDYFELWEGRQFESVHQLQTKQHLIWVLFCLELLGVFVLSASLNINR